MIIVKSRFGLQVSMTSQTLIGGMRQTAYLWNEYSAGVDVCHLSYQRLTQFSCLSYLFFRH